MVTLFLLPVFLFANDIKKYEGIWIIDSELEQFGYKPDPIPFFLVIKHNMITVYELDCSAPGCQNNPGSIKKYKIIKQEKENLWKVYMVNYKDYCLYYLKIQKDGKLIHGIWDKEDKRPLSSYKWVRVPKEHEAAFKKRLGLR